MGLDRLSCYTNLNRSFSSSWTHSRAEDALELLGLLSSPPEYWDDRWGSQHLPYSLLGIQTQHSVFSRQALYQSSCISRPLCGFLKLWTILVNRPILVYFYKCAIDYIPTTKQPTESHCEEERVYNVKGKSVCRALVYFHTCEQHVNWTFVLSQLLLWFSSKILLPE